MKRRRRNIVISVVVIALLLLIGRSAWRFWNRPLATASAAPNPVAADTSRFSVLILGADDRPGEPGRSDTMLLGFVDLGAGSVQLLSIPRDSYVEIPGHGWDKINASYAFGKEDLTRQTVEKLIGRPVDYTVAVNMAGFEKIVDTLGGIDVNVDEKMDYDDPYDTPPLHIHLEPGQQHLNGVQALGYVRFRHDAESDWGRMKRQQQFLKALLQAAERPANLVQLPRLIPLILDNVRTNLSLAQITHLALIAKDKLSDQSIVGQTLPGNDLWTAEGYYLALDFAKMRTMVHQLAGETPDAAVAQQDEKDAAAYTAALPAGSADPSAWLDSAADTAAGATSQSGAQDSNQAGASGAAGKTGATSGGQTGTPTDTQTTQSGSQTGTQSGSQSGGQPGTQPGAPGTKPTTPPATQPTAPDTPASPPGVSSDNPPWPLVVVDGTGDTQGALLSKLQAQGFQIVSIRPATGVTGTTIVWYGGSAKAADRLKELLPSAQVLHMTPGPNDPPLKLILGPGTP